MPDHRWLAPVFAAGAALGFLPTAFWLRGFDAIAGWVALGAGWFVGAILGCVGVALFLRRFPDAKYLTPEKTEGTGCVWDFTNVLMPYLVLGVIAALLGLLTLFNPNKTHRYPMPRLSQTGSRPSAKAKVVAHHRQHWRFYERGQLSTNSFAQRA